MPAAETTPSIVDDELLPIREVCRIFHRSRTSIYRDIRRQRFPEPIKLPSGAVLWRRSDLDRWVRTLTRAA